MVRAKPQHPISPATLLPRVRRSARLPSKPIPRRARCGVIHEIEKAARSTRAAFARWFRNSVLFDSLRQFDGFPYIGPRRHLKQEFLGIIGNGKAADKRLQAFTRDALAAREFLQLLVGIFHAVAAH